MRRPESANRRRRMISGVREYDLTTGDFHAVTAAQNLCAAMIEASLHHGNMLNLDPTNITWRRALDVNDQALRRIMVGLGGPSNGPPRETGFDITAASETMAILALATSLGDLRQRLARAVAGLTHDGRAVTAGELRAAGAGFLYPIAGKMQTMPGLGS